MAPNYEVTQTFDHVVLQDTRKTKTIIFCDSVYDYKTWQDRNLPWWTPTHKIAWLFDHVALLDHVTN